MVTVIRTAISGSAVTGGGVQTFCFEDQANSSLVGDLVSAVEDFWAAMCTNFLDDDVTFQVESVQPRYAAETGELQEVFSEPGGSAHTGAVTGSAAARASQGLLRWRTDSVVSGRLLQGRTFVPGIPVSALTDTGLLSDTYIDGFTETAEDFLTAAADFLQVWHRPQNGTGGSAELVTGVSTWQQLAVLRSRRD